MLTDPDGQISLSSLSLLLHSVREGRRQRLNPLEERWDKPRLAKTKLIIIMLRSFNPFVRRVVSTASARVQKTQFSSNITRLGVDVLPPMSQAVVHNGIVYLSGQVDGTAEDVTGKIRSICQKGIMSLVLLIQILFCLSQAKQKMSLRKWTNICKRQVLTNRNCLLLLSGSRILRGILERWMRYGTPGLIRAISQFEPLLRHPSLTQNCWLRCRYLQLWNNAKPIAFPKWECHCHCIQQCHSSI